MGASSADPAGAGPGRGTAAPGPLRLAAAAATACSAACSSAASGGEADAARRLLERSDLPAAKRDEVHLLQARVGSLPDGAARDRKQVHERLWAAEEARGEEREGEGPDSVLLGAVHRAQVGGVQLLLAVRRHLLHPLRLGIEVWPDGVNHVPAAEIAADRDNGIADRAADVARPRADRQLLARLDQRRPARFVDCAVDTLAVQALCVGRVDNRAAVKRDEVALRHAQGSVRELVASHGGGHGGIAASFSARVAA